MIDEPIAEDDYNSFASLLVKLGTVVSRKDLDAMVAVMIIPNGTPLPLWERDDIIATAIFWKKCMIQCWYAKIKLVPSSSRTPLDPVYSADVLFICIATEDICLCDRPIAS